MSDEDRRSRVRSDLLLYGFTDGRFLSSPQAWVLARSCTKYFPPMKSPRIRSLRVEQARGAPGQYLLEALLPRLMQGSADGRRGALTIQVSDEILQRVSPVRRKAGCFNGASYHSDLNRLTRPVQCGSRLIYILQCARVALRERLSVRLTGPASVNRLTPLFWKGAVIMGGRIQSALTLHQAERFCRFVNPEESGA